MTGLGYWLTVGSFVLAALSVAYGARALYLLIGPVADLAAALLDSVAGPPASGPRHAPAAVAAAAAEAEREFVEPPSRLNPATLTFPAVTDRGALCRCGHYRDEHALGLHGCHGAIDGSACTCLGFRGARRAEPSR